MSVLLPPDPDHFYVVAIEVLSGLTALCGLVLVIFRVIREGRQLKDEAAHRKSRRSRETKPDG